MIVDHDLVRAVRGICDENWIFFSSRGRGRTDDARPPIQEEQVVPEEPERGRLERLLELGRVEWWYCRDGVTERQSKRRDVQNDESAETDAAVDRVANR